jgi:surface carbohydrate biosynthesis protein
MSVLYPVLYLPSEIHNRDWDARLLIADHAAAHGFTSVVGQQWVINVNYTRLPPGLVLVKTVNEIQLNVAEAFRAAGHVVVTMDEEAFAVAPDQGFLGILSPRLPQVSHAFFANSPLHADVLLRLMPAMKGKVVPTGNARTDLLVASGRARFAADAAAIKADLGRFVLFNSNLAQENSIWTNKEDYLTIQVRAGGVDPSDPKSVERFHQQFEFERSNSKAFMSALHWCLDNLPTHRIVVRPHPVERPEFWQELSRQHPRLHVADNTHHIPWMMAADAVVHTNSTTGLEAAFLERPTVNLVPNTGGHWENIYVGTRVNPTFSDWRDGVAALAEFLSTGGGRLSKTDDERAELRRYFPKAFDGRSAQRVAANMVAAMQLYPLSTEPFNISQMIGGRLEHYERSETLKRKFVKDFAQVVEDFKAIRKVTGLQHPWQVAKVAEHCFAIGPGRP